MTMSPDPTEVRDRHITELRDALKQAIRWLSFSAGLVAADEPGHAQQLMATAEEMTQILARTTPE